MNAFLHPHNNGPSLTGIVDVTAHSVSLFQENEPPKNINDISIHKSGINAAEPYDAEIAETGNHITHMYYFLIY